MSRSAVDDALWEALARKDHGEAARLKEQGADLNMRASNDDPLVLWAVKAPRLDILEWLAVNGADLNARDAKGDGILHHVVTSTDRFYTDLLQKVLPFGMDPNLTNNLGTTPLMATILRARHHQGVEVLLAAGANPNIQSLSGTTALSIACGRGLLEVAEVLVKAGAKPGLTDLTGENSYHAAATSRNPEMVPQLLSWVPSTPDMVNQRNRQGVTPCGRAISHFNSDAVEALLDAGANVHERASCSLSDNMTVLMLAAAQGNVSLATKALALGANPNLRDDGGSCALSYAINQGLVERIKEAKKDLASTKGIEGSGQVGEQKGCAEEKKPDPNQFDTQMLRVLVENGADPTMPLDAKGMSPWLISLRIKDSQRRQEAWDELLQLGFPLDTTRFEGKHVLANFKDDSAQVCYNPLSAALVNRDKEALLAFLERGASPDALGPDGETALHHIAHVSWSQAEMTALALLGKQMRMQKDPEKQAASEAQVLKRQEELMAFVLEAAAKLAEFGGNWGTFNEHGLTPVHTLVATGRQDVLGALWGKWDMNVVSRDGDNLLATALLHGQVGMLHALLALPSTLSNDYVLRSVYASPESHMRRQGYLTALRTITDKAALNVRDESGNTPLIVAAATCQEDVVGVLLELGADPDLVNNAGESAMFHAVHQSKGDIIQGLRCYNARRDQVTQEGETAASLAIKKAERHVIAALDNPAPESLAPPAWSDEDKEAIEKVRQEGVNWAQGLVNKPAPAAPSAPPPALVSMRM